MVTKEIGTHLKKFGISVCVLVAALTIFVNVAFVKSAIVGVGASCVYIVLVGYLLGKMVFREENEFFPRAMFGIFILLCLLIFIGTLVAVFYELNALGLMVILSVPLAILAIIWKFLKPKSSAEVEKTESIDNTPYFSASYVIFLVLAAYSFYLLIQSRTGWAYGSIWTIIKSPFLVVYLLSAFVLIGIVWLSHTRAVSKLLLVIVFSLLSSTIAAIVVYPGLSGDPISQTSYARTMFYYGTLRRGYPLSLWFLYYFLKEKALALLSAMIARMFVVDVYWVVTFMVPFLWGLFVPIGAYKIARFLGGKGNFSVFAAVLAVINVGLITWSAIPTGNSFGFIFFFMSLCFSLSYMMSKGNALSLSAALLVAVVSWLAHPFTGMFSFAFLFLAMVLKKCATTSLSSRKAYFIISISLLVCVFILPAAFAINNVLYLYFAPSWVSSTYARSEIIAFSVEKLIKTDLWALIFGEYVERKFTQIVSEGLIPLLGILGAAYAIHNKGKYRRLSTWHMFFAFMVCLVVYRMLLYAMIRVPFGPGRIWVIRDLIATPFAAIAVASVLEFLGGRFSAETMGPPLKFKSWMPQIKVPKRQVLAVVLIGLSFSAFALSATHGAYNWLVRGLQPTGLEVEAVKYIDENTKDRYIVVGGGLVWIGRAFVGIDVLEKNYLYAPDLASSPTVGGLVNYMKSSEAGVGYFIASSVRSANFGKIVAEASRIFGLFKVLRDEHGQIYIFYYKIPHLPIGYPNTDGDVMAFYWETPPSYIVQNGLMRVVVNTVSKSLDVMDFWGDLYESIDLNATLVDEQPLGNLTSVEYFSPSNNMWIEWDPNEDISPAERFEFQLRFQSNSLVGTLEKGKPFVQLAWQDAQMSSLSLRAGDFKRLYVPGLIGGTDSYNVTSREYGLFYTHSLNPSFVLHPENNYGIESSSLTFSQVAQYCKLSVTTGYVVYNFYIENKAAIGQWGFVEVWLPDHIHGGSYPPLQYSRDGGKTWSEWGVLAYRRLPITTVGGADVNWVVTMPREFSSIPKIWISSFAGMGGPLIFQNFTDSGGGQNRLFLDLYLPAQDKVLVSLGASVYGRHPLKMTYVFKDSDDISYGLRNMKEGLIKLYNYGKSVYVGGTAFAGLPTSLTITQDETGRIESINPTTSSNTFYLFGSRNIDTTFDQNGDGVPDNI